MSKERPIKRNSRKFQFKSTCGKRETITAFRNSYGQGVLFEHFLGISSEDWDELVKWVNERKAKR